jgi:hypothetical protein
MAVMSTSSPAGFSRRRLLAGAAGLVLLAGGCTSGGSDGAAAQDPPEEDRVAGQVPVQEALVAAFDAAAAADPALGGQVAPLAEQARAQLERLREAAPAATSSATATTSAASTPPAGADVRGWLREQVAAAAASHAGACVDASGARAALLGSVAAGLRGHEAALA